MKIAHRSAVRSQMSIPTSRNTRSIRSIAGRYSVIETGNPATALTIGLDPETRFDLLLTDVMMPDMTGRELAKGIAELRSNLRVLYTSGYAEDAIVEHGVLEPGLAFVAKPFTAQGLLQAVRRVLDASEALSA